MKINRLQYNQHIFHIHPSIDVDLSAEYKGLDGPWFKVTLGGQITGASETIDDAILNLAGWLDHAWHEFAMEDDDHLEPDAQKFKRWLLANITHEKEAE